MLCGQLRAQVQLGNEENSTIFRWQSGQPCRFPDFRLNTGSARVLDKILCNAPRNDYPLPRLCQPQPQPTLQRVFIGYHLKMDGIPDSRNHLFDD